MSKQETPRRTIADLSRDVLDVPGGEGSLRSGAWRLQQNAADRETEDALAARGYLEAFRSVKASVAEILGGKDAAEVVRMAHHEWHQALFAPSVQTGLLAPAALAGYRRSPVFIRGSRRVPLPAHAPGDAMETLFDLLAAEEHSAVRAVLGHFVFVFIHPTLMAMGEWDVF